MDLAQLCDLIRDGVALNGMAAVERAPELALFRERVDRVLINAPRAERQAVLGLLTDLCSPLAGQFQLPEERDGSPLTRRYAGIAFKARQIIEQHFCRKLTLDGLAAELGVGAKTLSRAYEALWRTSVAIDLRRVRCKNAVDLIVRSDLKIGAVALDVGLRSKKDLYRLIRNEFGMTPGELRRSGTSAVRAQRIA